MFNIIVITVLSEFLTKLIFIRVGINIIFFLGTVKLYIMFY